MSAAAKSVHIDAAREEAVEAARARIQKIEQEHGVTRASLDEIKAVMIELAGREELFPSASFPPPPPGEKGSKRYLLGENADGRFAMYMLALNPGNETKPHDHTTWAVVSGVEGRELNRVYRREDDGADPDHCKLALDREVMVEAGSGIALMPEDIHSIHTRGNQPTRHLHTYGLALERLDARKGYDLESGEILPYNRNFMKPTENR